MMVRREIAESLTLGFHFGEGIGLPLLFLLCIPIDFWSLGLVARTVFLERLRLEPPASLGLALWVRFAVAGALYLPFLWVVQGGATDLARSVTKAILEWRCSSISRSLNASAWSLPREGAPHLWRYWP